MAQKVIGIECGFSGEIIEIPFQGKEDVIDGDEIIFKDEDGAEEFGVVKFVDRDTSDKDKILFTSRVLRRATPNDIQKVERCIDQAKQALRSCRKLVASYKLDMQVFQSGISFDGKKARFMFTSEDRVDFRDLVKDLAKSLKKQIYLRQVGPRDKAKHVGGYGKCGRPLCCNTFLGSLESISMEMARIQGLEGKGSSKLSGACGKLLCCLKYEVHAYRELKKRLPSIGSHISMKKSVTKGSSEGKVIGLDILNQKVKIFSKDEEYLVIDNEDVDKVLATPSRR